MAFGTLRRVAVVALVILTGCAEAEPSGRGLPRGVVFVRDETRESSLRRDPEHSRIYRDGKLVARLDGRVFAVREFAGNSLLYDYRTKTARLLRGGSSWRFDPCPDVNGLRVLGLSQDGRRGLCAFTSSNDRVLVLFDTRSPERTRRVIFKNLSDNRVHRAAWIDHDRIAVIEHRPGCKHYSHYGDAPAGLVIIDTYGRILDRGPCMAGVVAGPHGLIYVEYFVNFWHYVDAFRIFGQPRDRMAYSTDRGRSWRYGYVQFVDGAGHVFVANAHESTLHDESDTVLLHDVSRADWAKQ